jgi:hypothetical protein
LPLAVFQFIKKAVMASGMTGNATFLFNFQQHGILIAVDTDGFDDLLVAGLLAFVPQFLS